MDKDGIAKALADAIAERRRKEIFSQTTREISQKTYDRYFGAPKWNYRHLDEPTHGFTILDPDTGKERHYTSKRWKMKKVGKKMHPLKSAISKDVSNAYRSMGNVRVSPINGGYSVTLEFVGRLPQELGGEIEAVFGEGNAGILNAKGRKSSFDVELMETIEKWVLENGMVATVDSVPGKEGRK